LDIFEKEVFLRPDFQHELRKILCVSQFQYMSFISHPLSSLPDIKPSKSGEKHFHGITTERKPDGLP